MRRHDEERLDRALRAIAHPARRRLLRLVRDDELTVGELAGAADLSQPGTSQHLRILRQAGLVNVTVAANRRLYRADPATLDQVHEALAAFWDDRLADLGRMAESRHRLGHRSPDASAREQPA
jgi:DNA-binding transcriptional ArsR family regulator